MSNLDSALLAIAFGLTATISVSALGYMLMREIRRDEEQHLDALYRAVNRAFCNERLRPWQQIARAQADNPIFSRGKRERR